MTSLSGLLLAGGRSKREQELDISEQVVLKARQLIGQFEAPETTLEMQVKKMQGLAETIRARLSPYLMEVYSQDYKSDQADASSTRSGMSILANLQKYQDQVDTCALITDALNSSNNLQNKDRANDIKATLVSHLQHALSIGVRVPKCMVTAVIRRCGAIVLAFAPCLGLGIIARPEFNPDPVTSHAVNHSPKHFAPSPAMPCWWTTCWGDVLWNGFSQLRVNVRPGIGNSMA